MSQVQVEYSGGANNPDPLPQSNIQAVEYTDVYSINYDAGDTCAITSTNEPGPLVSIYSVGTKNIYYKLGASYNQRIGLLCYIATSSLINRAPRQITVTLSKTSAPTGTIYCRVYDYANSMIQEYSTISAATLTTLDAAYTFTDLNNLDTMQHKSKLCIVFTGGDAANYINVNVSDTDAFDGQNTVLYRMTSDSNGAVESVNPTQDLAGTISI
jgi:hypothetical protein